MPMYSYEVLARPAAVGGGWRLRLLMNDEEVGGGLFPAQTDAENKRAFDDADWEGEDWLAMRADDEDDEP